MNRFVPLIGLALSLVASSAQAQHFGGNIAMRWDNCYGDGGVDSRTFACDTNSGTEVLVVSAFPPAEIPQLTDAQWVITVMTTGENTPDWWQFGPSGCRGHASAALGSNATPPATSSHCLDAWQGNSDSYSSAGLDDYGPTTSRIFGHSHAFQPVAVPAGVELFIAQVVIVHANTVDPGSCGGCSSGVCLGLEGVRLDQAFNPGSDSYIMIDPLPGTNSDVVGWQMSGVVMPTASYPDPVCDRGGPSHLGRDQTDVSLTDLRRTFLSPGSRAPVSGLGRARRANPYRSLASILVTLPSGVTRRTQ